MKIGKRVHVITEDRKSNFVRDVEGGKRNIVRLNSIKEDIWTGVHRVLFHVRVKIV